ncbi:MAG: beta-galactosidase [Agriterribacter sp.]
MKNNFMKIVQVLILLLIGYYTSRAQVCVLDASHIRAKTIKPIDMHGKDPKGNTLAVNNTWFEKNGQPWFPLMGEIHYTRVPEQEWESGILKMKSAGLSVIATYVFWNEHETSPGIWNWTKNHNLRRFIELCAAHNMYVWLRIGPWCHGEQLHGGFPNWIETMKGKRSNAPEYLAAATHLFHQVGEQTKGMFFNDGGPVIGVQLENEYASGQAAHISSLKQIALQSGIRPVYWSVTANTVFDDKKMEVIPLQGSYCYRGWERAGGGPTADFLYGNDQWIMTDALGKVYYDLSLFPRGLCEQGAGSQMTNANRFVVEPHVEAAHMQNQLGRGMNMIGYYMFYGGTQTPGLKEPGYPESYDFQAPVGEYGLIRPSYHRLKQLHHFINDFGSELAQMQFVEPANVIKDPLNTSGVRYAARVKENSGFLFLCNTQVRVAMPDKQVTMQVKLAGETIVFPSILLKGQTTLILPFNITVNDVRIQYATAQPLAKIEHEGATTLFLVKPDGVDPEIAVDLSTVRKKGTKAGLQKVTLKENSPLQFVSTTGKKLNVVLLSAEEAQHSWRARIGNKNVLLISDADLVIKEASLQMQQTKPEYMLKVYPAGAVSFAGGHIRSRAGVFDLFKYNLAPYTPLVRQQAVSTKQMNLVLPTHLPENVSDVLLQIDYLGSSCNMLQEGKLVSDHLFNGMPWTIATRHFLKAAPVTFQIKEWQEHITGVDTALVNQIRNSGSMFKQIKAIPQYSIEWRF